MRRLRRLKKTSDVFSITGKYLWYAKEKHADLVQLKKLWAEELINHLKIYIQVKGSAITENEPCIFVGNHISYLDIPILIFNNPTISFVSKKEVKSWPIIGHAADKAQTIFVDRDNAKSRASVKDEIIRSLVEEKKKVVIFPSGTTSILPTEFWKKGAFEIASKSGVSMQPFRISYEPLRPAAYIDQDNFLTHMYRLFELKKIDVFLEFHEPVKIKDIITDCHYWKKWCERGDYGSLGKRG